MIDFGIILSTFLVVFFAELGDKTQLVAFSMTSTSKNPLLIFIATSLALSLSSVLAAIIGGLTANFVPGFTKYISAGLFFVFGAYILLSKEAPKIKECFLQALAVENQLIHVLPKVFKGDRQYKILDIMRQEKSHSELFKILLKEKILFKDDINDDAKLDELMEKLEFKSSIHRLPFPEALDVILRIEEASCEVFQFLCDHLDEDHHHEVELQMIFANLVKEEKEHILFFKNCQKDQSL